MAKSHDRTLPDLFDASFIDHEAVANKSDRLPDEQDGNAEGQRARSAGLNQNVPVPADLDRIEFRKSVSISGTETVEEKLDAVLSRRSERTEAFGPSLDRIGESDEHRAIGVAFERLALGDALTSASVGSEPVVETTETESAGLSTKSGEISLLTALSGEMGATTSAPMSVDYNGPMTLEEVPNIEYSNKVGYLGLHDPSELPIRGFSISYTSMPGAFKIVKEETEYGPQWYLAVDNPELIDYETIADHKITLTIVGRNFSGDEASRTVTLTIANKDEYGNEAPEDIILSNSSIDENSDVYTVVGELIARDIDASDHFQYEIVADEDNKFTMHWWEPWKIALRHGATLDRESEESHWVTVRATDSGGLFVEKTFIIDVNDIESETNYAPHSLLLGGSTMAAIKEIGGRPMLGALNALDRNGGDTITYSIIDDHDTKFYIDGGILWARPTATFDFETKGLHYVTVRATDSGGESVDNTFSIYVQDVNERPNNILLSSNTIAEGSPGGTVIGDLSASDPDGGAQTFTYQIISDPDGKFVIQDNQLKLRPGASLNHEPEPSHAVTIQVTDQGG